MNNLQIKAHISAKTDIKNNMHKLWEHINNLNVNVGLSKSTMDELQEKISIKIAQCEKSIQEYENLFFT